MLLRSRVAGTDFAFRLPVVTRLFCFLILFTTVDLVRAATLTWTGGGASDDTSLAGNWGGTAPATGDLLHFAGSVRLTPNQLAALSIGSLTFDSGAGSFTLSGGTYTITTSAGVANNSTNSQTINNNLTLGIAQTWTAASGNLIFGGNIATGGFNLTIGGASNTSASGTISGTGSLTKTGSGTLTLSGANTFSGGMTINAGKVTLNGSTGSLASSGGLTFGGTGTFNYQGATTGSAQTMGTLSFAAGDGTVQSTYGTSGNTSLTFSSLAARTVGATENFVITGGTNGTTNKIVLTGVSAGFINQGTFFNGSDFAFMNGAGTYVRGINYGVDANSTIASSGTLSLANQFTKMTVSSTVANLAINTLNISGASNLTLGSSKTLTLTNGGLLKSGGGASTISGGSGVTPGSGVELVIRTDTSSDSLTISSVILANGTNALTKSGAGTLTLSGANTYTGVTTINGGTLNISADNNLGAAPVVPTPGKLALDGGTLGTTATFALIANRGISLGNSGGTIDVAAGTTLTYSGIAAGNGSLTKNGTGTLTLSGLNTYTGATNINAGTLKSGLANSIANSSAVTVATGATYDLNGFAETVGSLAGGGTVTSGVIGSLILTAGGDNTSTLFSGILQNGFGTLAFTKTGTGTLTLSGNNSYSGLTTVSSGILDIQNANALGTTVGTTTVALGATLQLQSGISVGAEPLTLNGTGVGGNGALRNLSGNNSLGGLITLASNSTIYADAGTLTLTGGIVNAAFTTTFGGAGNITESGVIGGTGAVTKSDTGTLTLSGINTYSGGSTLNGGTVIISASTGLGAIGGTATINAATLDIAATFTSTRNFVLGNSASTIKVDPTFTFTANGIFTNTGALNKTGTGTLVLGGTNTFTGSTTISAGTLQVNVNDALGTAASGTTVASGAVLMLNNVNYSTAEPLTLNGTGISNGGAFVNSGTSTFAGPINAATNATINAGGGTLNLTGGLSKNGTTLTFAGGGTVNINTNGITGSSSNSDLVVDGVTVNENAANSYNGPTYIRNGGTLNANVANALPTANGRSAVILDDSGTGSSHLVLGAPQGVASLTGASSSLINLNGNTLTIGDSTGTTTFAGIISGTGGLTKDGASTQTISGANTYSGATTINGGSLTLANSSANALGSTSGITVNSGGTLALGQSNQINDTAAVTLAGGTFAKGDFSEGTASTPGVGALTLTASGSHLDFGTGVVGVLTFASFTPGSFSLTIDNWTGTPYTVGNGSTDRLIFASDQTGNLSSFSFTGYGPGAVQFDLHNGYWEVTAVPVPETSTWIVSALALGAVGFHLVRRRNLAAVR